MAKLWKHLMLVAGLVGLVGIFLPLIETRTQTRFGPAELQLNAYQLSFGFEKEHQLLGRELPRLVEKRLSPAVRDARADARIVAEASKGAILLFAPALALLALGLFGLVKQRFGRVVGTLALVCSATSIAAFFGLRYGIEYGMQEAGFQRTVVEPILASYFLIAAGLVGLAGALGALVKPQHPRAGSRRAAAPPTLPPPMPPPPGPAPSGAVPSGPMHGFVDGALPPGPPRR